MSHATMDLLSIRSRLEPGKVYTITGRALIGMTPPNWKDELPDMVTPTREEWLRRTCRGLGLTATHYFERDTWTLRRERSQRVQGNVA